MSIKLSVCVNKIIPQLKHTFPILSLVKYRMCSTQEKPASILVDKIESVTTIGINRPSKRNCVNFETGELLKQAIENFENDVSSPVAVLYGIGGNFCAGYDLSELSTFDMDAKNLPSQTATGHMGPTRRFIKKPMVAAISGYAVAGGMELALMCDLRVMEETAIMGVFCRRFGVPLIDGGTVRLPAIVGLTRALELILTGRAIDAKEALEWGLVNKVVACGTALGQAINLANSLVKFPQQCLNVDRVSTYHSVFASKSLEESLQFEKDNAGHVIFAESVTGAKKFVGGTGRHGKFHNLTEKEKCDWENDTKNIKNKL